jgi:hypothetical protein
MCAHGFRTTVCFSIGTDGASTPTTASLSRPGARPADAIVLLLVRKYPDPILAKLTRLSARIRSSACWPRMPSTD